MLFHFLSIVSGTLIILGIGGALCRRNLLAICLCLHIAFLGVLLLMAPVLAEQSDVQAISIALVFIVLFSLEMMLMSSLIIFTYRNLGSLHIDEMRQLRG